MFVYRARLKHMATKSPAKRAHTQLVTCRCNEEGANACTAEEHDCSCVCEEPVLCNAKDDHDCSCANGWVYPSECRAEVHACACEEYPGRGVCRHVGDKHVCVCSEVDDISLCKALKHDQAAGK